MDLYKIWWQWPKYVHAKVCLITFNNLVQVCTCQYKMFRGISLWDTVCIQREKIVDRQ